MYTHAHTVKLLVEHSAMCVIPEYIWTAFILMYIYAYIYYIEFL